MAWSEQEQTRILNAINERLPKKPACPLCGNTTWTLASGYILLTIQHDPTGIELGGSVLPNVALVCDHCGNTQLLNLLKLGLSDLMEGKSGSSASPMPVRRSP